MNIVDILIIAFLLMGSMIGFKRGLIGSIVGLFSSLIGLFVAHQYYAVLGQWLNTQFELQGKISVFLNNNLVLPQAVSELDMKMLQIPDLSVYLDKFDLPLSLKGQFMNYINSIGSDNLWQAGASLGDVLHQFLAVAIINGISFLLIWFVVDKGIMLVSLLYSRIINNTVLGGFDRVGGLLIGTVVSVLALTIIIGVFTPLLNMADIADNTLFSAAMKTLGESQFIPYFTSLYTMITDKIFQTFLV